MRSLLVCHARESCGVSRAFSYTEDNHQKNPAEAKKFSLSILTNTTTIHIFGCCGIGARLHASHSLPKDLSLNITNTE